ncbi:Retron-type reverse transcriptase [Serratia marcescens]|uniref:retron St85 family RNA-directed DNA polymerase n=1 Tax=Serratia TaxID=613 RepID=UPI000668636B|nr:retron St85 family RNA-directed DNA polymerase [Serratia marcescens]MDV5741298.1 retron St85 family RNA-directed DNA polymerase [Serratia marcescens]MDV5746209.1 retron St85 family RNA-directed DNA polymerase [Serratia marcescens]MDV5777645.1 retron St85 family RNA-directed DNA polymerase [Serratia marcescens]MDV5782588.1 retron St85 family RNA-directed DNA polymerase [Serratia marcescens]MDV5829486.1 retron St85 family RNA-directed DNA polymerase [Serratia marcescens]
MNIIEIISKKTMLSSSNVMAFIHTAPYRYKKYYLQKNSGGLREIAQPSRELKVMQRLILDLLVPYLPVHENAFAYIEGKSIKRNALMHHKNEYLLKMDFSDFFNSIKPLDLRNVLIDNNFETIPANFYLIDKLFFYKKTKKSGLSLSVGAPSSPLISNAVLYDFDVKVSELCKQEEITYTRYADDLTFSCNEKGKLLGFQKEITKILRKIKSPKLKINDKKTIHASRAVSRRVTGIIINNNGELSLGRHKKRMISSLIHRYTLGQLNKDDIYKLKGYLSYAKHIDINFILSINKKYGVDTINSITKYN